MAVDCRLSVPKCRQECNRGFWPVIDRVRLSRPYGNLLIFPPSVGDSWSFPIGLEKAISWLSYALLQEGSPTAMEIDGFEIGVIEDVAGALLPRLRDLCAAGARIRKEMSFTL